MLRFFIRIILILFVFAAGSVVLMLVSRDSRENLINRSMEDTKASSVLTGRFVEHLINERVNRLYSTAYSGETPDVLRSMVEYTDFVASTYGHRGSFMIGLLDSGFNVVNSINSSTKICGQDKIINEEIASRLIAGKIYVGPVSEGCKSDAGVESLMMLAVPISDNIGMKGAVYEISTLMDYINSYKQINYFSDLTQARLFVDDIRRYERSSDEYKLLSLKGSLGLDEVAPYNGRMAGFYSFYVQDVKLCLVYIREMVKSSFTFTTYPVMEEYKEFIFMSPLVLLVLWIILEMVYVNEKLGDEVRTRTKHLENLRKRYQGLFATIPEYVVLFNRDGGIIECNGRFTGLLKSCDENCENVIEIIREKERFKKMLNSIDTEFSFKTEEFHLECGEVQIPVSVNACPVELDGADKVLAVMTDISDYKKMQNAYFLTQKREVVGTLAAGMVHDFSNILQNISLQFNLLDRSTEDARQKNMDNIKKILDGANNYLSGVLRYTRDVKDDVFVKRGSAFVRDSIDMLERVLPTAVKVSFIDNSGGIKIKAGQVKITQMLINLCQNASDAMDGRGEIIIEAVCDEKPYGNFFKLSVSDTGKGIEPENMDNIYKPFFTTKGGKGTGIGLATVRQVVVEFGGFIEVDSTPGVGTKFTVMFAESK